jgi:ATP-dependent DNA helicase RecG
VAGTNACATRSGLERGGSQELREWRAIQISVYPDKLMIWNPGELPPAWTVEKLLGKHASIPFNPDVASVFFRAGMIESWGRGIERILEACRQAHTPTPELRYEHTGLWVEFRFLPEHRVSAAPITGEVAGEVAGEVERLVLIIEGRMSRVQLQRALDLRHEDHFRGSYLTPALQGGFVEMTIPGKPRSSRQQYRLTAMGQALRVRLARTT